MFSNVFKIYRDPYNIINSWLSTCGLLRNEKMSVLNVIILVIGLICCCFGWFGPFMFSVMTENISSTERIAILVYGSSGVHIFSKSVNVLLRQREVKEMLLFPRLIWTENNLEKHKELKKKADDVGRFGCLAIFASLESLIPIIILKTVYDNRGRSVEERRMAFPCWFGIDPREWFTTTCVISTITLLFEVGFGAVCYSFMYFSCVQATYLMKIICEDMETRELNLKESFNAHVLTITFVKKINEFFAGQMVLEAYMYGVQIATTGYTASKMARSETMRYTFECLFNCIVFIIYIGFSYLNCTSGQQITTQSEKLFESIYQNGWYDLPIGEQKALCIMMCAASRSFSVQYKRFSVINMERYALILQATYSFVTLLGRFDL